MGSRAGGRSVVVLWVLRKEVSAPQGVSRYLGECPIYLPESRDLSTRKRGPSALPALQVGKQTDTWDP